MSGRSIEIGDASSSSQVNNNSNNDDEFQKLLAGLDQLFDVDLSPQDQAINSSSDSLDETAPLPEDGN